MGFQLSVFNAAHSSTTASSSKKDSDTQPLKSATLTDLDEEADKGEDSQAAKFPIEPSNQVRRFQMKEKFCTQIDLRI